MSTLVNLFDARVEGMGTKYTDAQKLAAYMTIDREKDPEKRLELLFRHADGLGFSQVQNFYDEMTGERKDSMLTDALRAENEITEIEAEGAESETDVRTSSMVRREQIRQWFKDNPDKTPDQKKKFLDGLLNPVKEEMVKKRLSGMAGIKQGLRYVWQPSSMVSDILKGTYFKEEEDLMKYSDEELREIAGL